MLRLLLCPYQTRCWRLFIASIDVDVESYYMCEPQAKLNRTLVPQNISYAERQNKEMRNYIIAHHGRVSGCHPLIDHVT